MFRLLTAVCFGAFLTLTYAGCGENPACKACKDTCEQNTHTDASAHDACIKACEEQDICK